MAGNEGGILTGLAVVIGAACSGFVAVYSATRKSKASAPTAVEDEARHLAAMLLAQEMIAEMREERRGHGARDSGERRRAGDTRRPARGRQDPPPHPPS